MPQLHSLPLLNSMTVASPCPASWAEMAGSGRVRFCRLCEQSVYNLSEMTRSEAEELIQRTEGRLCARFYQRPDGTVMTRDCPEGQMTSMRRKVWVAVGAALVLLLTIAGFVVGLSRDEDGARGRLNRGRLIQPFRGLLDWLDPQPPIIMGGLCPPEKDQPEGPVER